MKKTLPIYFLLIIYAACNSPNRIIFTDEFENLPRGPLGSDVGAHTEYHYLHEAKPKGNWAISTFRYNLPPSWYVRDLDGKRVVIQDKNNYDKHWHPMLVAGDDEWQNYIVEAIFSPLSTERQSGIVFRYVNSRSYYLAGILRDSVFIKRVHHGVGFREPDEKILTREYYPVDENSTIRIKIEVDNQVLRVSFDNTVQLTAVDSTFQKGKIALLADAPAIFHSVHVRASKKEMERIAEVKREKDEELARIREHIPRMALWKKIQTPGFGTSRNLRFGDMDGDGSIDILIGQVVHHGHKDRNSELSCLTAVKLNGEILWQIGRPDEWKTSLTNDVAFQVHDIYNDGKMEVVYTMNQEIIIADAATGKTIRKVPTPPSPGGKPTPQGHNIFPRILGDCILFCDLTGQGFDGDFIIKDRYRHLWAYNNKLELLWENSCNTGHYPYAYDIDNDGRDEILMGYTLFSHDGKKLWSLDSLLSDHADGVAIVPFKDGERPKVMIAASDEGMIFTDIDGNILKHHYIGHVQNPAIANFRDDLPGLETVSINFWGNQGLIHFFDADGDIYHSFEPSHYGSMMFPLNWTGRSEEFFVLNANVDEGGAYDGWGRRVLEFPDDGHPDKSYFCLDVFGDSRDEIIVWDPHEIWIYTQADNPREDELFIPKRNALYNISNYQATVSR